MLEQETRTRLLKNPKHPQFWKLAGTNNRKINMEQSPKSSRSISTKHHQQKTTPFQPLVHQPESSRKQYN